MVREEDILQKLESHQLRKTAFRKEVLELFMASEGEALSNQELESQLDNPDRITLYRTLKAFEDKGLIHLAADNGGISRYALCLADCTTHAHHDQHAHFQCRTCGKTICLEGEVVIRAQAPVGFKVERENLTLEGLCDECL
ncbi:MAG: transcriptional repressor [Phaeodactylibacter sp.]|uniref:Fur family transcriptional regulator n=1 Tax=Phaeodactylibacter sp. TaxID=1940289 RepID=UPI0032EC2CFB